MIFSYHGRPMFTDYWKVLVLNFPEMGNAVFFEPKKMMETWYLLITGKFLFWTFRRQGRRFFFEPKSWWKDDIYWLLENSCFGPWKVLALNFFELGNTVFFWAKKLMERWYLLGLFELSKIFQDLRNMVFRAVLVHILKASIKKSVW